MSPNCLKRLLHKHANTIDFLSASIVIVICLVVLLPKVHDSFLDEDQIPHDHLDDHLHDHHHAFPTGEVLVCLGFFFFYCLGALLSSGGGRGDESLVRLIKKNNNKTSTICCSSTRCPSSLPVPSSSNGGGGGGAQSDLHQSLLVNKKHLDIQTEAAKRTDEQISLMDNSLGPDSDCLLLLNRHHNHHTHHKHHKHDATSDNIHQTNNKSNNYGSLNGRDLKHSDTGPSTTIIVDEILITTMNNSYDKNEHTWPLSIRMLIFSLILGAFLIFFQMNVIGLIKSMKVFRAASTGALLYIAFFLMLPSRPVGCNSCSEEEEEEEEQHVQNT